MFSHPILSEKIAPRIDQNSNGCWEWTGAKSDRGYGHLMMDRKTFYVHRLVYEMAVGPIPEGFQVCHRCDNRICCRPEHLFTGTNQDNIDDMVRKGRSTRGRKTKPEFIRRGERNPATKFTDDQIQSMRELVAAGVKQKDIAILFSASRALVCMVVNRKVR